MRDRIVVGDGAMGTMLQAAGPSLDDFQGLEGCNEVLNVSRPDIVASVHAQYFEAGVDFVETNSFGANLANLAEFKGAKDAAGLGIFELDLDSGAISWDAASLAILRDSGNGPPTLDSFLQRIHPTDRAAMLGIPVSRLNTVVWAIAGALAYLALFLRSGISGVPLGYAAGLPALLVALAALVIGRLERLPTIACAAMAFTLLESGVNWNAESPLLAYPIMAGAMFIALLAHELRNPLAPIRNGLSILQRLPGEPQRVEQVTGMIDRQVGLLSRDRKSVV